MIGPFSGEYRFLSNFWLEPARGGLSNEHFFQAEKTLDPVERAFVMRASGPIEAKKRGRMITLREDWEAVKQQVMLSGLRNKFYLDVSLGQALIDTGDEYLCEVNTWNDTIWGAKYIGTQLIGHNYLGRLLMEVRAELQDSASRLES